MLTDLSSVSVTYKLIDCWKIPLVSDFEGVLTAPPRGHSVISGYIFVVAAAVATILRSKSLLLCQVQEPRGASGLST